MERFTQVTSIRVRLTVKAEDFSKMETATLENGGTVQALVREVTTIQIVDGTKARC